MARSETSPQRPLLNEQETERSGGIVKEVVGRVVAVVVLASVGVAVAAYYPSWPSAKTSTSQATASVSDHDVVLRLEHLMNPRQDPCKDFYAFVCDNYQYPDGSLLDTVDFEMYEEMERTIQDASIDRFSKTHTAAEKAGSLYLACISRRRNEEWALREFLRKVGLHWSSYASGKILDKILFLFFRFNINTLLRLYLEDAVPLHNGQRKLAVSLNEKQLRWFELRRSPFGTLFYENTLGFPKEEIVQVDNEAAGRVTEDVLRGLHVVFNTVLGLESLTPTVNQTGGRWTTLVEAYTGSLYRRDYPILASQAALQYFDKLYADLGNRKLSLLTAWALLRMVMPLTIQKVFRMFNWGTKRLWCRQAVFDAMEVPLISWYLFPAVPPSVVRQGRKLADDIQLSILQEIKGSRWIDKETKKVALDKISRLSIRVGYPKKFDSFKAIDEVYAHYPFANGTFLFTWLTAMNMTMQTLMQKAYTYRFSVRRTTAAYSAHLNMVRVPATALRAPLFSTTAPDAVNYGGLGAIVGHEIMHAFGKGAIYYNAKLEYSHWWTAHSMAGYDSRLQCMRRMYNISSKSIDNEMLSDFAGLVAAHDAYTRLSPTKRHESFPGFPYKDEQLFFITYCLKFCNKYADVSPSSKYASWRDRCEVPLRMMGAFGQAFRCPAGSPMWIYNESRRCTFW